MLKNDVLKLSKKILLFKIKKVAVFHESQNMDKKLCFKNIEIDVVDQKKRFNV